MSGETALSLALTQSYRPQDPVRVNAVIDTTQGRTTCPPVHTVRSDQGRIFSPCLPTYGSFCKLQSVILNHSVSMQPAVVHACRMSRQPVIHTMRCLSP